MPLKEAMFWFGLTVFGTGLYFFIQAFVERKDLDHKIWMGVITLLGAGAAGYSVYRYYYPEALNVPVWVGFLILTWLAIAYDIRDRRFFVRSSALTIHSAVYGTGPDTDIDVTEILRRHVGSGLAVLVTNELAGCDPLFGVEKRLEVEYSFGNPHKIKVVRPERSRLVLPEDTWLRDRAERISKAQGAVAQPLEPKSSAIPDIALLWDWTEDKRKTKQAMGFTEKDILIHNRSDNWIYNVEIAPVVLHQTMTFDKINEVEPGKQHLALARWNGRKSSTTNYIYFFGKQENERAASAKGWINKKLHSEGISDFFLRVPMTLSFEAGGKKYQQQFSFIYDPGDESLFEKVSTHSGSTQDA